MFASGRKTQHTMLSSMLSVDSVREHLIGSKYNTKLSQYHWTLIALQAVLACGSWFRLHYGVSVANLCCNLLLAELGSLLLFSLLRGQMIIPFDTRTLLFGVFKRVCLSFIVSKRTHAV